MQLTFLRVPAIIAAITLSLLCQLEAQTKKEIRLYRVMVKADKRYKGILEKVTQNQIFITTKDNKCIAVDQNALRVLKIKDYPKKKRTIMLLQPEPGASAYDRNGFLKKDYLDSQRSLGEQVAISTATVFLKVIYGNVSNALHNLRVFRIKRDSVKYKDYLKEMGEYAAYNQAVAEDDIILLKNQSVTLTR